MIASFPLPVPIVLQSGQKLCMTNQSILITRRSTVVVASILLHCHLILQRGVHLSIHIVSCASTLFLRLLVRLDYTLRGQTNTRLMNCSMAHQAKALKTSITPEIASTDGTTAGTEAYDALKVQAILNEIDGKDHTGAHKVGIPAIFGMNFQAVSVTQKLAGAGYLDAKGTPSPALLNALNFVDQSLGKFVQELRKEGQLSSTTIIVTAKHGQTPIDPSKTLRVSNKIIPALINAIGPNVLAQATQDDVALLWLKDQSKTQAVVKHFLQIRLGSYQNGSFW